MQRGAVACRVNHTSACSVREVASPSGLVRYSGLGRCFRGRIRLRASGRRTGNRPPPNGRRMILGVVALPYKDPEKRREYNRIWMHGHRLEKKAERKGPRWASLQCARRTPNSGPIFTLGRRRGRQSASWNMEPKGDRRAHPRTVPAGSHQQNPTR